MPSTKPTDPDRQAVEGDVAVVVAHHDVVHHLVQHLQRLPRRWESLVEFQNQMAKLLLRRLLALDLLQFVNEVLPVVTGVVVVLQEW